MKGEYQKDNEDNYLMQGFSSSTATVCPWTGVKDVFKKLGELSRHANVLYCSKIGNSFDIYQHTDIRDTQTPKVISSGTYNR